MDPHLEIDYRQLSVAPGDVFLLASDGVYEHLRPRDIATILARYPEDLTAAARALVTAALSAGSPDNLTAQLVRIDALPEPRQHDELGEPWQARPFAPEWQPGQTVDGFHILRTLHASSRSRVYLAQDLASGTEVVLKCPATELREQPDALAAFQAEEWVAGASTARMWRGRSRWTGHGRTVTSPSPTIRAVPFGSGCWISRARTCIGSAPCWNRSPPDSGPSTVWRWRMATSGPTTSWWTTTAPLP